MPGPRSSFLAFASRNTGWLASPGCPGPDQAGQAAGQADQEGGGRDGAAHHTEAHHHLMKGNASLILSRTLTFTPQEIDRDRDTD